MKKKHNTAYRLWVLFLVIVLGLSLWLTVYSGIEHAKTPHYRWLRNPESASYGLMV